MRATVLALLLLPTLTFAGTLHVPDAYPSIAAALLAAQPGDTLQLAPGSYRETDLELPSDLTLLGRPEDPSSVVWNGEDKGRCFTATDVTNLEIAGVTFLRGRQEGNGGAALASGAQLLLRDCIFLASRATRGAGLFLHESEVEIQRCRFSGNVAWDRGGGIQCWTSSPIIEDCIFIDDNAETGGGIFCDFSSEAQLRRCTFYVCSANLGGAAACWNQSHSRFESCTFVYNFANIASVLDARYSYGVTLDRCILAYGEGIRSVVGVATLLCCDVWGNEGGDWIGDLSGQQGINGNLWADPLFCGDLNPHWPHTLRSDSPCAPEGGDCGLVGAWPVGCGATAARPESWSALKQLY